ncbi:hypothetical protein [uncultured Granulicatella sp.]|uniref:hypothetical protein n=1 Tax=uncultured Granulicatella sp. TaxID=316089 RepID=UPI0026327DF3|nr:hypothetical protein [uncultured Granulicatella sp.]
MMKWIKSTMIIAFLFILTACGKSLSTGAVQEQVVTSANSISNYHITVKQSDYKEGTKTPSAQTIASASAWKDGTGYGSKIDKTSGKVTNQLEVIADANIGFIRYYQDKWEQTITATSSLQNTVVFPYTKLIQFTKEIHQLVPWTKGWQGYEKSYSGDDEALRKAVTSILGIATNDTSKVELKIKTDAAGNLITNVEIKVVDEGEQTRKEYTIAYLQFNEQQKKALPK